MITCEFEQQAIFDADESRPKYSKYLLANAVADPKWRALLAIHKPDHLWIFGCFHHRHRGTDHFLWMRRRRRVE